MNSGFIQFLTDYPANHCFIQCPATFLKVLLQRLINHCLIAMSRLVRPVSKFFDYIIIKINRYSCFTLLGYDLSSFAILCQYLCPYLWASRRHGQLFQNSYESIVCQEDVYLRELVRCIHLNPVRAGIVSEYSQLNNGCPPTSIPSLTPADTPPKTSSSCRIRWSDLRHSAIARPGSGQAGAS